MAKEPEPQRDASWAFADRYDESYYATGLGEPYHRGNPVWRDVFGRTADFLVERYKPSSVLDVGCGIGFLVEALRARRVDAYGIDISDYAIAQVPKALRKYCTLGSVTDDFGRRYDLITCIEVLEHLPAEIAEQAVANLARHTDTIVFSSTPDDEDEPTHINVRPAAYWIDTFASAGFFPRPSDIATVVSPQAIVFERGEPDLRTALAGYESRRFELTRDLQAAMRRAHEVERDARAHDAELRSARRALADTKETSTAALAELRELKGSTWWRIGVLARSAAAPVTRQTPEKESSPTEPKAPVSRRVVGVVRPLVPISVRRRVVARFPSVGSQSDAARVRRGPTRVESIFAERFPGLRALPVYPSARAARPRLTLVTDSLSAGSLFGGVGTSLIFGALLAQRLGASLRIVTRNEPPEPSGFGIVLAAHGIPWNENVEFLYSSLTDDASGIPWGPEDVVLSTSWWTTWSALQSVDPSRIVYLLQEDERLFYPAGDEQLLCSEVLGDDRIMFVVNTELLYQHLLDDGFDNLAGGGVPFEPAFPESIYYHEPRLAGGKRRFFFYARPSNSRNLFVRGLEAIQEALASGVLDPDGWEFHFVGKDIPQVALPLGVVPTRAENLPWTEYAELIRTVDLGLSLVSTPHPSYPPLDLAACGAVAVSNRWGTKQSLSGYSANILSVDVELEHLVAGLAQAVALVDDDTQRMANYAEQRLSRSWESSFAPAIEQIAKKL